jgi:hypothetical protein
MGRKTRTYSRVNEAQDMISTLCDRHKNTFWAVKPENIAVMGIDNVERSEKAIAKQPIWAKMRTVKGAEAAMFREKDIPERHIIEVHWSDWNEWHDALKAAVLASLLLAITPEVEVKNSPDCVGFKILYKALGVNWERDDGKGIPNLLTANEDDVFDLDLRPGLAELEAMDEGDGPEDMGDGPDDDAI